jgi:diacylglycerol kinase family enzyme
MAVSAQEESTNRKPVRHRKLALVLNAQAGALLGQSDMAATLQSLLLEAGDEVQIVPPESGSLPERLALAKASGADCVVVGGGDGTVACAATSLLDSGISLGLIPCGTMNLLAKDLHIDPADQAGAVRILAAGQSRTIDAGMLGQDVFLCASMLGTPARLSRHREAGRQRGNGVLAWAAFGWAALRALLQNRSIRVVLRLNGRVLKRRTPSLTITVNRLDDGAGRLFGRSNLSGGELGVYLVRRSSVPRQALLLLRTALTGRLREPEVEVFTTQELEVGSVDPALHVLLDGELQLLKPPLRYRLRPGALTVVAPA